MISGWVIAAPLLGVFIGLGVTAIALWVGSEMILTLVILAIGIAIGGMFIAGGVWSIFANGGPHIIQAVILIGFGLIYILYVMARLDGD